jgi:hypothetical protein
MFLNSIADIFSRHWLGLAPVIVILVLLSLSVGIGIRKAHSSPLGHIPGTWHSLLSDVGVFLSVLRLQKLDYIDRLFERYGPVVRIGPNTVGALASILMPHTSCEVFLFSDCI